MTRHGTDLISGRALHRRHEGTADRTVRVLKHGDTFAVFDHNGDMAAGRSEQGLYHEGTRSCRCCGCASAAAAAPLQLARQDDNDLLQRGSDQPGRPRGGHVVMPRDVLHVFDRGCSGRARCYEQLRLWNYLRSPVTVSRRTPVRGRLRGHLRGARHAPAAPRPYAAARDARRRARGFAMWVSTGGCAETRLAFDPSPAAMLGASRRGSSCTLLPQRATSST